MFCTKCGKKLHEGDLFCAYCGTQVRQDEDKSTFEEIVFNPPFKRNAEARTSEVFKGFETEEMPKVPKKREAASFDWNLDGFPSTGSKKTEEVDFNWDSVMDSKRRAVPYPVVDKIEPGESSDKTSAFAESKAAPVDTPIEAPQFERVEAPTRSSFDDDFPLHWEPILAPKREIEREPLFDASKMEREAREAALAKAEAEKAAKEAARAAEIARAEAETKALKAAEAAEAARVAEEARLAENAKTEEFTEEPLTTEELEKELFEKDYKGISSMSSGDAMQNTAQLEKFYTYNQKKEAFQELLDKEYEKLRGMEDKRVPDEASLEFTWAGGLFPPIKTERPDEKADVEKPADEKATDEKKEEQSVEAKTEVPADTIDFSPVREEARIKKIIDVPAEEQPLKEESDEPESYEKSENSETPEEAEACSVKTQEDIEEDIQEAQGGFVEPIEEVEADEKTEETEEAEAIEESGATEGSKTKTADADQEEHAEKAKLRYSDIFPREAVAGDCDSSNDAGNNSDDAGQPDTKQEKIKETLNFLDDDDDDYEPRKMNIFVKIIIIILSILIIFEGVIIALKFFAPESEITNKVNVAVESVLDRLTGGDGKINDDDSTIYDGTDEELSTVISEIISDKIEKPDTIGEIAEDSKLEYDLEKNYAYEEIAESENFVDGEWADSADEKIDTYAQGIVTAVAGYYGNWQVRNDDTDLVGINKLEIGEIRVGKEGYYVLCRLTFAGADGKDVVKGSTVYVKISQNKMVIEETKEERL